MARPAIPLSVRVPLIVAGLMVIVGVVASQIVIAALAQSHERQARELARTEFATLAHALAPMAVRDDVWAMFDLLDRSIDRGAGLSAERVTLVGTDDSVAVSSDPQAAPIGSEGDALLGAAQPLDGFDFDSSAERITLHTPLSHRGQDLGALVIDFDARALAAERRAAWRWLVLGNALATLTLAGAGFVIVRRLLRPVAQLAAQMQPQAGPPRPIPPDRIPERDPELARLYRSYNRMLEVEQARVNAHLRSAERERLAGLGRLAGSLAHEINNPLGGLLNAVDTIRRYPDRAEVVRGSAELLDRGLRHLRDVVRATLDTHRTDRASGPLACADLDDLRLLIGPEIARQEQDLDWEVSVRDADLAALPGAPVRQIALNLLLNASAVAGHGGAVGFEVSAADATLCLCVSDTGPGLPEALRPRLLSDAPVAEGEGVGLGLVRQLAGELGGEIILDRTAAGRNRVRIHLPLRGNRENAA